MPMKQKFASLAFALVVATLVAAWAFGGSNEPDPAHLETAASERDHAPRPGSTVSPDADPADGTPAEAQRTETSTPGAQPVGTGVVSAAPIAPPTAPTGPSTPSEPSPPPAPPAPATPDPPDTPDPPEVPEEPDELPIEQASEPEPDELNCPNLGLVPIGYANPDNPIGQASTPRFRAARHTIPPTDALVCAEPLRLFRDDMIVQNLSANGRYYGVMVGGRGPHDPVMWLNGTEWASYNWRNSGPTKHNFSGIPMARIEIDGVPIIRTSRGGIVMERSDSYGFAVVGGAWDLWIGSGGPRGEMGLPAGKATGTWFYGAHQDFTRGTLGLPGVYTDLEAEVMPPERYVWLPLSEADLALPGPTPGTIVEVSGVSYYVDIDGVRHWISSTGDWNCATWNLSAPSSLMRGWQIARVPLGPVFVCPPG